MVEWFKRSWANLLILVGLALGAAAVFFQRRRESSSVSPPPAIPPPPDTPPVALPPVNPTPATTYLDTKTQPVDVTKNGVSGVIAGINERHK